MRHGTVFRFSSSILVNCPLTDVGSVLIDFPRVPSWERGVVEVRQVSPGAPGVGTTLVARRGYAGRETMVACRITDWEELRGATMALRSGPLLHAAVRYAFEPVSSEQTLVTYTRRAHYAWRCRSSRPVCPRWDELGPSRT
jgi:hypothetical protein